MVNRINIFKPDTPMGYDDRIKILRQRKLEETQIKSKMKVYQDGDDYGSIPAPENFSAFPTMKTVPGMAMTAGAKTSIS